MEFLVEENREELTEGAMQRAPLSGIKKSYAHLMKADALRVNEMFEESIKHYLSALMLERNNIKIYIGLAQSYMHIGEADKAIKTLEKASKIAPDESQIAFEIGCCFLKMGLPAVAAVNLKEAILTDKENIDAQFQLGIAHELLDEPEMALMIYQRIIEKHPSYLKAYQHKAALLISLECYSEAAQIFSELLHVNPQYYKALLGIGICFDRMGKTSSAVRYYRKFLSLKPQSPNAPDVIARLNKIRKTRSTTHDNFLRLA